MKARFYTTSVPDVPRREVFRVAADGSAVVRTAVIVLRLSMTSALLVTLVAMAPIERAAVAAEPLPRVVAGAGNRLVVEWRGARSEPLPLPAGTAASDVRVVHADVDGRDVVLATSRNGGSETAWLGEFASARLRTAWKGAVGARDADGEAIVRVEIAADGVMRTQEAPGIRHCSGQPARLFAERFDFTRGTFVALPRPWTAEAAPALVAWTSPADAGGTWPESGQPAARSIFRFTGASTPARTPRDARTLVPPAALHDQDDATFWSLDEAGSAFATARSALAVPVLGVVLTAPPPPAKWPERLALNFGGARSFAIMLPVATAPSKLWVPLPQPLDTTCVTIDALAPAKTPSGLAEVRIVTALDTSAALPFFADRLALGSTCTADLRLVSQAQLSPSALAQALVARLPSASAPGQACLLAALLALPTEHVPAPSGWLAGALPATLRALASATGADRQRQQQTLQAWLKRAGPAATPALLSIAKDTAQSEAARILAVRLLADAADAPTRLALLQAAAAEAGAEKPLIAATLAQTPGPWVPTIAEALDAAGTDGARAQLLWLLRQRLAGEGAAPAGLHDALVRVAQAVSASFTVRARAIGALGALSAEVAAASVADLLRDEDPVVRHLATQALADMPGGWPAERRQALLAALSDRDPRVRQTAARGWARAPKEVAVQNVRAFAAAHGKERWPFVLSAHLEALAHTCMASPRLVHALEQPELPVDAHVVAIEGLVTCRSPHARTLALRWLKRQAAPAPVRLAAAQALGTVATPEDAKPLSAVLNHLVNEGAADPAADDVAVAVVQVLVAHAREAAVAGAQVMLKARRVRLRQAAFDALGRVCSPDAQNELARLAQSQDEAMAAAAARAMSQCQPGGA